MFLLIVGLTKIQKQLLKPTNNKSKHIIPLTTLTPLDPNCSFRNGLNLIILDQTSLDNIICLGQTLPTHFGCPSCPPAPQREKGSEWDKVETAPSQLSIHDLFFLLVLSINEWWKPKQREALLYCQTACVSQGTCTHTVCLSLLVTELQRWAKGAQGWRQRLAVGR